MVKNLGVEETIVDVNWETMFLFGFKDEAKNVCFFKSDVNSCKIINLEKKECGKGEEGEYFCV